MNDTEGWRASFTKARDVNGGAGQAKPLRELGITPHDSLRDSRGRQSAGSMPEPGAEGALLSQLEGTASCHELRLRFFGQEARIRSNSVDHIDLLDRMYGRFRSDDNISSLPCQLEIMLLTHPQNPWGVPVLIVDQDVWPLRDPTLLEGWVYDSVLSSIISRVRSHFLIHAGVVSWEGQGIVLPADARHGKTTLVLALVKRGFRFLSDETAALGRDDRWVHPFPRRLRVRRDTLERMGYGDLAADTLVWMDKFLVDIEAIHPRSMGTSVPIHCIVFLCDSGEATRSAPDAANRELSILVDGVDDELLSVISRLDGVQRVSAERWGCGVIITLMAERRMAVLAEIEALCRQRRTLILDAIVQPSRQPTFEGPARLEALPRSQAVMELLRRFQGGLGSVLLAEEFGGSAARLYWEMVGLVAGASCYRLSIGPLEQMADLVCSLLPNMSDKTHAAS